MSKQRTNEWTGLDDRLKHYHLSQYQNPKRSTVAFEAFIRPQLQGTGKVLDLGGGSGSATAFLAERHPEVEFVCGEYVDELITLGREIARTENRDNLSFRQLDWFDLPPLTEFDGVMSLQTLSWLPECAGPLTQIFEKVAPRWIALTSLFYEGDISARTEVCENRRDGGAGRRAFYNTYALPEISRLCQQHGYRLSRVEDFEIDIDLEKPADPDFMATYTEQLARDGSRIQISGPVLMNWKTLLIEKQPA